MATVAQAQLHNHIVIDEASLTPVQVDPKIGVTIDKIPHDNSNRPCARIKMHVNRMTRAEIDGLKVQPVGGSVVVMKQAVAAEGNGLIIELTAKEPTRFFLHHDKYGDSNEVSFNLEGDKEYKLEVSLNDFYSIVVNSNVQGAEVYIDGEYKGVTNDNYSLTIPKVLSGEHTVKVRQDDKLISEQMIVVDSAHISFRVEIKQALSFYVVFEVTPKDSVVEINGKHYSAQDGIVTSLMYNGSYSYKVSAKDYHTEEGTFVVNGAKIGDKVEKAVSLKPAFGWLSVPSTGSLIGAQVFVDDAFLGTTPVKSDRLKSGNHKVKIIKDMYKSYEANVTITDNNVFVCDPSLVEDFVEVTVSTKSQDNAVSIYVDGVYKAKSSWKGNLSTGLHMFEARKDSHRSTKLSQDIKIDPKKQSIKLEDPSPIEGVLHVVCTPMKAGVYVNGVHKGDTPLMLNLLEGNYKVQLRKEGYKDSKVIDVKIEEGKTFNVNETLEEVRMGYLNINSSQSGADVYVDGKRVGKTPISSYEVDAGSHTVMVSKKGYQDTSRQVYVSVGKTEYTFISMTAKSISSYSTPKSTPKKSKSYRGWSLGHIEGFNVGLFAGVGYNLAYLDCGYDLADTEFNVGLLWRLWRHDSLFNAMTGLQYMFVDEYHCLSIPAVVNWNSSLGIYLGLGTELTFVFDPYEKAYSGSSYCGATFPLVMQMGMGGRHYDINFYFKTYFELEVYTLGMRFAYLF